MKNLTLVATLASTLIGLSQARADDLILECPVKVHAPGLPLDNQADTSTFEISIGNKWAKESSPGVPAASALDLEVTNTQYVIGVAFDSVDQKSGWKSHHYPTTINRMTGEIFEGSDESPPDGSTTFFVRIRGVCHVVGKQQF